MALAAQSGVGPDWAGRERESVWAAVLTELLLRTATDRRADQYVKLANYSYEPSATDGRGPALRRRDDRGKSVDARALAPGLGSS